jgi:general L-amino acid transport system permease protein
MADVAATAGRRGAGMPGMPGHSRAVRWLRANLFSSWLNAAVSLALLYLLVKVGIALVSWAFVNAVWSVPGQNTQACRDAHGLGACWALIREKYRFILFATYPYEEQWREAAAILIFIGLYGVSSFRRFWRPWLLALWLAGIAASGVLLWGGLFGLPPVRTAQWGGLVITLILATFGIVFAFPLGVVLALGRRSRLPAVKAVCVGYIELIRGVPLVSVLFMASVMLPLFLPNGASINQLLRAQVAVILFLAAYLAEVVRGGLQAIPKGQYEAADALGLKYPQKTVLIVLPQALRIVIPPLVNLFIATFKDTALVSIIGIFDLLNAANKSTVDPAWQGYSIEAYIFISLIYFSFCFSMSRYSQSIEADFARARRR